MTYNQKLELWKIINEYVEFCGGNPEVPTSNTRKVQRQVLKTRIESIIREAERTEAGAALDWYYVQHHILAK